MPNRIIKESICTSETIDQLSAEEECLFYRIIVNCDDYGRADARIAVLASRCYPLRSSVIKHNLLIKMLNKLQDVGLLYLYCDGKYLQVKTWELHQQIRAKRSKFPAPGESDINGYHLISNDSICHRNPIQSESESESESKLMFDKFYLEYPRKKAPADARKAWAKINPNEYESIMNGLAKAKASNDWQKENGQYIPYPATFLNGRRWEDEYDSMPNKPQLSIAQQSIVDFVKQIREENHDA